MTNEFGPLDVTVRGPGEPEVVVGGGVHGEESPIRGSATTGNREAPSESPAESGSPSEEA